jgi:hypothetical protein
MVATERPRRLDFIAGEEEAVRRYRRGPELCKACE